jgi:hypothetical protein
LNLTFYLVWVGGKSENLEASGAGLPRGFQEKWQMKVAAPLFVLALAFGFIKAPQTGSNHSKTKTYWYGSVFLIYPTVVNAAIATFECHTLIAGQSAFSSGVLEADDTLLCSSRAALPALHRFASSENASRWSNESRAPVGHALAAERPRPINRALQAHSAQNRARRAVGRPRRPELGCVSLPRQVGDRGNCHNLREGR